MLSAVITLRPAHIECGSSGCLNVLPAANRHEARHREFCRHNGKEVKHSHVVALWRTSSARRLRVRSPTGTAPRTRCAGHAKGTDTHSAASSSPQPQHDGRPRTYSHSFSRPRRVLLVTLQVERSGGCWTIASSLWPLARHPTRHECLFIAGPNRKDKKRKRHPMKG